MWPMRENPVNASPPEVQESGRQWSSNDTASILPDTPPSTPKGDLLDYRDYASALVSVIERLDTDATLTVGIFGNWGSGKTTLLNLMHGELEDRNAQNIWVDVWKYGNEEDVWAAFLQALLLMVKKKMPWYRRLLFHMGLLGWQIKTNEVPRRVFELFGRIVIVVVPLYLSLSNFLPSDQSVQSSAGTAVAGAGTFLSGVLAWYLVVQPYVQEIKKRVRVDLTQLIRTSPLRDRVSVLDEFRTFFEAMVRSCVGRKGRLVVFVDDLDRCPPERIVEVLDALKLFLDVSRCVYVMGLDRDIIEQAVRSKFEGYEDPIAESREYLEKIIGLPFDMPPLSRDQVETLVGRLDINLPDSERTRKVFALGQEPNPRKIKRTINVFLLLWTLAKSRKRTEDKEACRLAKIVVVQHSYRDLYRVLAERPKSLVELELHFRKLVEVEGTAEESDTETKQSLPQVPDHLKPFIGNDRLKSLLTLPSAQGEENQKANFTMWRHGKYELLPGIEREIEGYIELTRTITVLAPESLGHSRLPDWFGSGSEVVGRQPQFEQLDEAWIDPDVNILSLVAPGGTGKSVLVSEWLRKASDLLLDSDKLWIWSFDTEDAADSFVEEALRFFGDENPEEGDSREKGERLARFVRGCNKPLLILDGLEPRQYPIGHSQEGELRDQAVRTLLIELAVQNPGLCLVTTRVAIADLAPHEGEGKPCRRIELQSLPPEVGAELLRSEGVSGPEEELQRASKDFEGHALSLTLLGTYLRQRLDGDIRKRDEVRALSNEQDRAGKHARRVIASYEEWYGEGLERAVLRLLGLFDLPENEDYFREFLQSYSVIGLTDTMEDFDEWDWRRAINNLNSAKLLSRRRDQDQPEVWKLDTHPFIRRYFREQLQGSKNAWREGNDRLIELYNGKVEGRPTTRKEADLLLQAMIHGCNAGQYQEALHQVYLPRIMAGEDEAYAENELGVAVGGLLSAISHFFEEDRDEHIQWSKPVQHLSKRDRLLMLTEAGRYLTQSKGGAAPEVGECYMTAATLSDEMKHQDPRRFFEARLGLSRFYRIGGKFENSYKTATELDTFYKEVEASQPDTTRSTLYPIVFPAVQRVLVTYFYCIGNFPETQKHAEKGAISYSDRKQALKRARLDVDEPSILCLSYQATALWFLGKPDQALKTSADAVGRANDLGHAHTLAIALLLDAMVHHFRRDPSLTMKSAKALIELSDRKGFLLWRRSGEILHSWSLAATRPTERGTIDEIRQSISRWGDTGAKLFKPFWYGLLGETCLARGQSEDGLVAVGRGLKSSRETGERWWDAELYRLKGELLLIHHQPSVEAEENFNKALEIARGQKAKSLELRAAMSLARVRKQQDREEGDVRALEEIYRSFGEGFETEDLKNARQLLDDLQ